MGDKQGGALYEGEFFNGKMQGVGVVNWYLFFLLRIFNFILSLLV